MRDLGAAVVDEGEQGLEAAGVGAGAAGELLAADDRGLVADHDLAQAWVVVLDVVVVGDRGLAAVGGRGVVGGLAGQQHGQSKRR